MVATVDERLKRAVVAKGIPATGCQLSICLVAHNAYRALTGLGQGHIGGVERQTAIMAKWFAARGHKISVLVWDEGTDAVAEIDGVRLIRICKSNSGLPVLRFLHPRVSGLMRAMREADADVYYHNGAEAYTGVIARWACAHGKRFVYSAASDPDVDPRLPALERFYERWFYRAGLKRAHRIFVQTVRQQDALANGFGRRGVVLPMPCPGPGPEALIPGKPGGQVRVLWVGRMDPVKRLELLLNIAEHAPKIAFDVAVANMNETDYARGLQHRAGTLSNVNWLGSVLPEHLAQHYRSATCLCCTSVFEGFPNTFIEAWSQGRPVLTSFDPDGLVARLNLGAVAQSTNDFVSAIGALTKSDENWTEKSRNARQYYLDNHRVEIAMPRFEEQFLDLSRNSSELTSLKNTVTRNRGVATDPLAS
jgi:glycosyltransferase involved in cell wall biosynthesis